MEKFKHIDLKTELKKVAINYVEHQKKTGEKLVEYLKNKCIIIWK